MDDILIRGGQVIDGTGAPARVADVAIRAGRIVAKDLNVGVRHLRRIRVARRMSDLRPAITHPLAKQER